MLLIKNRFKKEENRTKKNEKQRVKEAASGWWPIYSFTCSLPISDSEADSDLSYASNPILDWIEILG